MTGIALTSAQNATDYLFGERALPVIAGRLFFDQNNDGLFDSNVEYGISAEQILITGTNDLGQGVWLTLTTSSIPPYGEFDSGPIHPGGDQFPHALGVAGRRTQRGDDLGRALERNRHPAARCSSISTAGNFLPSRNSRKAPPAVEM